VSWILNIPLDFDIEQILVIPQEYKPTRKDHPNSILLLCRLPFEEQKLYFIEGLCTLTKIWFLIDFLSGKLISYFVRDMSFSYHIFTFPLGNMCVGDDRITFPSQKPNSLEKPNLDNFWLEASRICSLDCLSLVVCVINQCKMRHHTNSPIWTSNTAGKNKDHRI